MLMDYLQPQEKLTMERHFAFEFTKNFPEREVTLVSHKALAILAQIFCKRYIYLKLCEQTVGLSG
jgi:hypothetical protein